MLCLVHLVSNFQLIPPYSLCDSLTALYNESLHTGMIPLEWKRSHITPIHKRGSRDDPSNFCPIAVISVIAKILGKLVTGHLSAHLQSNHVLHQSLGAYQHGKSTADILLVSIYSITSFLDKGD